ncbi:1-phosphofructokinase [Accumulibacter sp.]|uniref:1-phosphofructokinase n=1 Tax=Accumulibacter sp. TaxID=2053492 RepID=UPI0026146786|nr:1-phosphofructokinase [Accumulibacter sp.]
MKPSKGIATVTLNPAVDQSVTIPGFATGTVNRVAGERSDPGGKGVNVASILADLGFRVTVTGLLGRDNAGLFNQLFASKGIGDAFVRVPGSTRINVKIIDHRASAVTEINFPGPATRPQDIAELERRIDALCTDHDCFVVSGSLPAGLPPTYYAGLIRRLKVAGKRVLLDSSGEALRHGAGARPWLIKPNLAELEDLLGAPLPDETSLIGARHRLRSIGPDGVLVSLGSAGALLVADGELLRAVPPAVEVRSTVGAGDALVAGFVAGELRGWSVADCARFATACAAAALTRIGPWLPKPAVIERLMAQVAITALAEPPERLPAPAGGAAG